MIFKKYLIPVYLIFLAAAVFVLPVFTGCSNRRDRQASSAAVIPEPLVNNEELEAELEMELEMEAEAPASPVSSLRLTASSSAAQPRSTVKHDETSIAQRHFLLSVAGTRYFSPEDFEIGRLIEPGDVNNMYINFINSFFDSLLKGRSVDNYFKEDNRIFLSNVFGRYTGSRQIPESLRIGAPVIIDNSLHFNLRLYKGEGRTEARIVLSEAEGRLFIKDFYGDLSELDIKYDAEGRIFEPEKYTF